MQHVAEKRILSFAMVDSDSLLLPTQTLTLLLSTPEFKWWAEMIYNNSINILYPIKTELHKI